MRRQPQITIVGAGNLGAALALALHGAGYTVEQILFGEGRASRRKAAWLAGRLHTRPVAIAQAKIEAEVVFLCVPDDAIAEVARSLADKADWNRKVALHCSGALTSGVLAALQRRGASVASVHPMMTFVASSQPRMEGVPFAVEGDARAVRASRAMVKAMGGKAFSIRRADKAAYHAWGTFASPLLTALLATTEQVAAKAGVNRREAKLRILPILHQTLANYAALGAAGAFSGPIVRGDVATIAQHLQVLRTVPAAQNVYLALAKAAVRYLPGKRKRLVQKLLAGNGARELKPFPGRGR